MTRARLYLETAVALAVLLVGAGAAITTVAYLLRGCAGLLVEVLP